MKKRLNTLVTILLWLGLFFIGYVITLYLYPNVVYYKATTKMALENNILLLTDLPNSDSRKVVKPNPDFLYVIAQYDLSDGPIQIKGLMPDSSYWSLALYQPNTINYYVKNDQQFETSKVNVIFKTKEETNKQSQDGNTIISPSTKGMLLFRILVTDPSVEGLQKLNKYKESIELNKLY